MEEEIEEDEIQEPLVPEDRATRVILPSSQPSITEDLPDSFYEITQEDLRFLIQTSKVDLTLKTKKMREMDKPTKNYFVTRIRVRFPDRSEIQGIFYSHETTTHLREWTKQFLTQPDLPFDLYITPPHKDLQENETLSNQQLVPAALVHFCWTKGGPEPDPTASYLKSSLFQTEKVPMTEPMELENRKTEEPSFIEKIKPKGSVPKWFSAGKKK